MYFITQTVKDYLQKQNTAVVFEPPFAHHTSGDGSRSNTLLFKGILKICICVDKPGQKTVHPSAQRYVTLFSDFHNAYGLIKQL